MSVETVIANGGPTWMTVSEALLLPVSDGPGIGGERAVALTAETVKEYVPGQ